MERYRTNRWLRAFLVPKTEERVGNGIGVGMASLVACPCGHGVEEHTRKGCPGTARELCTCLRTPQMALDAAVSAVRSTFQADRAEREAADRGFRR